MTTTTTGSGGLNIYGIVASNTMNNKIEINGDLFIKFDKNIIAELSEKYNFVRPPYCGKYVNIILTHTKQLAY